MKPTIVSSKEEAEMLTRQERRENARRVKEGLEPKTATVFRVQETKVITSNKPTPKRKPAPIQNTNGLPARPLTEKEQEVLQRTLLASVEIIDEGEYTEPLVLPAALLDRRKKAKERRDNLIQGK